MIFITAFNCEKYIQECIVSVAEQSFQNISIILVDDCSTDQTYYVALQALECLFPKRFTIKRNDTRIGKAGNAFLHLNGGEYVFCAILDGDDYLLDRNILKSFDEEYKRGYDVVWSNYRILDGRVGDLIGHSAALNPLQSPRTQGWKTSHFFSFRYKLFGLIPKFYFTDSDGNWLKSACDQAIAYPILDQTRRYRFINRVSYFYRTDNPNCHHNKANPGMIGLQLSSHQQRLNSKIVFSKPPLPLTFGLADANIPLQDFLDMEALSLAIRGDKAITLDQLQTFLKLIKNQNPILYEEILKAMD